MIIPLVDWVELRQLYVERGCKVTPLQPSQPAKVSAFRHVPPWRASPRGKKGQTPFECAGSVFQMQPLLKRSLTLFAFATLAPGRLARHDSIMGRTVGGILAGL